MGWLGQACITLGVLILLFVAYQLWGTNLAEARSQNDLQDTFRTVLEREPADPRLALPPTPEGEAVAIIKLPKINVEKAVVEGVKVEDLKKGPGHYPDTPLPGQPGNAAIAGHRTTYGAPFNQLDKMSPGDKVVVTTKQGAFDYEVMEVKVVSPRAVEVLEPTDDNRLTLTTCHPRYSASQRMIADGRPQGPRRRALPPVRVEAAWPSTTGLSGDSAARGPAAIWGGIAAPLYLLIYLVGRWWRRWPAYVLGAPVLLLALFFFFENFARLLPANY